MPTTLQAIERRKNKRARSMADLDRGYAAAYFDAPKFTMRKKCSFGG